MNSNINEINKTDIFLIGFHKHAELFIANKSRYASAELNLEDLIVLRKKVTEEIIKMMRDDKSRESNSHRRTLAE